VPGLGWGAWGCLGSGWWRRRNTPSGSPGCYSAQSPAVPPRHSHMLLALRRWELARTALKGQHPPTTRRRRPPLAAAPTSCCPATAPPRSATWASRGCSPGSTCPCLAAPQAPSHGGGSSPAAAAVCACGWVGGGGCGDVGVGVCVGRLLLRQLPGRRTQPDALQALHGRQVAGLAGVRVSRLPRAPPLPSPARHACAAPPPQTSCNPNLGSLAYPLPHPSCARDPACPALPAVRPRCLPASGAARRWTSTATALCSGRLPQVHNRTLLHL
jgi:hypothetical protein